MKINFHKVAALPATLEANAMYYVQSTFDPTYAETYVTDNAGVPKMVGNTVMIDQRIAFALSTNNQVEFAPDFATMNSTTYTKNVTVFVLDASADPTVDAGSAYYFFEQASGNFYKVSEFESLDLVINWTDIVGGPTSTPAQIDAAVADAHIHANKTELDKIGEDADGDATYNTDPIQKWKTLAW